MYSKSFIKWVERNYLAAARELTKVQYFSLETTFM